MQVNNGQEQQQRQQQIQQQQQHFGRKAFGSVFGAPPEGSAEGPSASEAQGLRSSGVLGHRAQFIAAAVASGAEYPGAPITPLLHPSKSPMTSSQEGAPYGIPLMDLNELNVVGTAKQSSRLAQQQQGQHQQQSLQCHQQQGNAPGENQQQQQQRQEWHCQLPSASEQLPDQQQHAQHSCSRQLAAVGSASEAEGAGAVLSPDVLELLASLQDRVLELEAKLSKER